jgi:hypothetical protein
LMIQAMLQIRFTGRSGIRKQARHNIGTGAKFSGVPWSS